MSTPSKASGVASATSSVRPSSRRPAGRARRREQAQLPDREPALVEHLDHRPADDAGGPDDGDGEGFRAHYGHGSAVVLIRSGTAGV